MTAAGRVPRWLMEMAPEQYAVPVSSVIYQPGVRHPERCSAVHFASGCGRCPPDNHLGNAESRELHKTD
jgi:hypothetical protein